MAHVTSESTVTPAQMHVSDTILTSELLPGSGLKVTSEPQTSVKLNVNSLERLQNDKAENSFLL